MTETRVSFNRFRHNILVLFYLDAGIYERTIRNGGIAETKCRVRNT